MNAFKLFIEKLKLVFGSVTIDPSYVGCESYQYSTRDTYYEAYWRYRGGH